MMKQLQNMQIGELKTLLSSLKQYRDMKKKLGSRGMALFHSSLSQTSFYRVEFFPALGQEDAYEQAMLIYQKSFSCSPSREDILFVPCESLKGGMRVIKNDEMVDMSYAKVEKLLKK